MQDWEDWNREQEDALYPVKESGPNSHDVWEGAAGQSAWLGYVERENVPELGMMWAAYRAHHNYAHSPGLTGTFVDHYDAPEDGADSLREFWRAEGN